MGYRQSQYGLIVPDRPSRLEARYSFADSELLVLSTDLGLGERHTNNPTMYVNLAPTQLIAKVNAKSLLSVKQPVDSVAILPPGTHTLTAGSSFLPSLAIDIGPETLRQWMRFANGQVTVTSELLPFRSDRIASNSARAIIEALEPTGALGSALEVQVLADLIHVLSIRFVRRLELSGKRAAPEIGSETWRERHDEERLRPALQLVADRLADSSLKVADLADEVGISPAHFAPLFKRHFGVSPYAYIRNKRIELGVELARMTQISLAEVADQAGFADQSHMTTVFSRVLGATPKQIRQRG